jgi:hypothetical protein
MQYYATNDRVALLFDSAAAAQNYADDRNSSRRGTEPTWIITERTV